MKRLALWLLACAAGVYVLAVALSSRHPAWSYVAAFAEAAMVGAVADWFAVVALFRHSLGLPIPHTAVIPHNKSVLIYSNLCQRQDRGERFEWDGGFGRELAEAQIKLTQKGQPFLDDHAQQPSDVVSGRAQHSV